MPKPVQRKNPTVFPYRGKFRLQYVDAMGRQRTKTAATKLEAFRELAKLERQLELGFTDSRPREIPTVGDWFKVWLTRRESDVRMTTFLGFESTVRLHIAPHLGGQRLDLVRAQEIEALYKSLMGQHELSPATVRKVHAVLNQGFITAVRYGILARNPMVGVRIPKSMVTPKKTLSSVEVRLILDAARADSPELLVRALLALRLGMRQGECLALTWADIDTHSAIVSVTKSVDAIPGVGSVVTPPKSQQSNRNIPIDSETLEALKTLHDAAKPASGDTLLFSNERGGFKNARVDYDSWKRLLVKAGVRPVKLHDARHAAATLLLKSGADARTIQLLLGHSSPSFTLATYVHPETDALRAALSRVSIDTLA